MELRTDRLVLRPVAEGDLDALRVARDLFERAGCARIYAGVDPTNEKSLRVVGKAPGVRKIDDELYELTAEALRSAWPP